MSDLRITVDGSERSGRCRHDGGGGLRGRPQSVIAARVGGELRGPRARPGRRRRASSRSRSTPPTAASILRHSTAHVMAQAVQELYPDARLGIGPPIENGFYYDFDVETAVHPRRPAAHRQADAADRQGGPVLRPPGGHRRRGPRRARRRAVQARADRPQGRRRASAADGASAEVGAGELTIYDNVRKRRLAGLEGPLPRSAPAHAPGTSRRSS